MIKSEPTFVSFSLPHLTVNIERKSKRLMFEKNSKSYLRKEARERTKVSSREKMSEGCK